MQHPAPPTLNSHAIVQRLIASWTTCQQGNAAFDPDQPTEFVVYVRDGKSFAVTVRPL